MKIQSNSLQRHCNHPFYHTLHFCIFTFRSLDISLKIIIALRAASIVLRLSSDHNLDRGGRFTSLTT